MANLEWHDPARSLAAFLYLLRRGRFSTLEKRLPENTPRKRRRAMLAEHLESTEESALRYAEEFLADIGAALLAGPAFLFALLPEPAVSTSETLVARDQSRVI